MFPIYFVTCPACGLFYGCGEETKIAGYDTWREQCPKKDEHTERAEGEAILEVDPEDRLVRANSLLRYLVFKNRKLALNIVEEYQDTLSGDLDSEEWEDAFYNLMTELVAGVENDVPDGIFVSDKDEDGKVLFGLFRDESLA